MDLTEGNERRSVFGVKQFQSVYVCFDFVDYNEHRDYFAKETHVHLCDTDRATARHYISHKRSAKGRNVRVV